MYALSIKENYMIDKLNEALAESLGDAMDCLRVWEARFSLEFRMLVEPYYREMKDE